MGLYTDRMEAYVFDLDPLEDGYRDKLLEVAGKFRSQAKVLEELMKENGYTGDFADIEEKYHWMKILFKESGVEEPRNLKAFLLGTKHFDRDKRTPFQLCFAFSLTLEEAEMFFRRSYMGRGIDYHSVDDVVYAYCIREGLAWKTACDLLENVDSFQNQDKRKDTATDILGESAALEEKWMLNDSGSSVFTGEICGFLKKIHTKEDLVQFLRCNRKLFLKNNVTARKKYSDLWVQIIEPVKGFLILEEMELVLHNDSEKVRKPGKAWSEEAALKHMLGISEYRGKSTRSLTDLLKDNQLIHHLAADCFPNRNAIRSILSGKPVSYESIRKLLILLLFYRFWIRKALKKKSNCYQAEYGDTMRCMNEMNSHLMEAGYPALYYGNPYDWLFLFFMQCEEPLCSLREYMWELYSVKTELTENVFSGIEEK